MSTTDKLRDALTKYLVDDMGANNTKEFSEVLRQLDVCDLRNDADLKAVTGNGLIDTLLVLYKFGTLTKLLDVKKQIRRK